jgi:hypothetical protein
MTAPNLDRFETLLLDELRNHVAANGAALSSRQPRRRMTMVAAAAAVTGLATGGIIGMRPEPAFAVERQANGDVVVTISELKDAGGLERALSEKGVTADVVYLPNATKPSDLGDGSTPVDCPPKPGEVIVDPSEDGEVTITLTASYVASLTNELKMTVAEGPHSDHWIGARVTSAGRTC